MTLMCKFIITNIVVMTNFIIVKTNIIIMINPRPIDQYHHHDQHHPQRYIHPCGGRGGRDQMWKVLTPKSNSKEGAIVWLILSKIVRCHVTQNWNTKAK